MKLTIELSALSFDQRWPKIRIYNNDTLIDDVEIAQPHAILNYHIAPSNVVNILIIDFYNKSFGDNNIWDLDITGQGLGEMKLSIDDIKFDDVSVDHLLTQIPVETQWTANQLSFVTDEFKNQYNKYLSAGEFTFNGQFKFPYEMPVYEFLIDKKYKKPRDSNQAFYSNSTELFHYEHGLGVIDEIKRIIKSHE